MDIEQTWVMEAVEGRWFGVLRSAGQTFIESSTKRVNGTVTWTLNLRSVGTVSIRAHEPLYLRDREELGSDNLVRALRR